MIVRRRPFEVDIDGVVAGYVSSGAHAPSARAYFHATARLRFRQDEEMAALDGDVGRRVDGGGGSDGGSAAAAGARGCGRRAVAAVAEVEHGEVKLLTAADGDAQRRALGGAAGQTSGVVGRLTVANQITAAE